MKKPSRSALDARFAVVAAICLVVAELVGAHLVTQGMLRREVLRAEDASIAQTELLTSMAAPALRFNRGPALDSMLLPIAARNPALMAARFERSDGLVVHEWARSDFPARAGWWQPDAAPPEAEMAIISRAAMGADGAQVGRVSIAWDKRPIFAEAATQFRTVAFISVAVSLALGALGMQLLRRRLRRFRKAEEATRDLAMRDPLTGIRNRRGLTEALESGEFAEAWATGAPIMLALADLDGFKPVNDTYGHAAGDELLKQIAHRLDREVARQGIAARLGGDEFALMLLLDPADPDAAAEDAAKRLMGVVRVPFTLHPDGVGSGGTSVQVRVGLSLGVALAPEDATDPAELMRRADSALYRAKAEGRGRYRRFVPEMDPRLGKRRGAMRLEAELREALAQDGLTCHYQPIRQLVSGQLLGFEALARWPHAMRGFVSPAEFIPIAEANGLIIR
jgi:diguanylate cyclase (GGDEF)-like protein